MGIFFALVRITSYRAWVGAVRIRELERSIVCSYLHRAGAQPADLVRALPIRAMANRVIDDMVGGMTMGGVAIIIVATLLMFVTVFFFLQ